MTNKTKFGLREAIKAFADEAADIIKEKDTYSATYRQKAKELGKSALSFLSECEKELWTWKKGTAKGGYPKCKRRSK